MYINLFLKKVNEYEKIKKEKGLEWVKVEVNKSN